MMIAGTLIQMSKGKIGLEDVVLLL